MSDNSNSSPALPPAGWYPDPHGAGDQRYWDGAQWTAHTAAPAASGGSTAPPAAAETAATLAITGPSTDAARADTHSGASSAPGGAIAGGAFAEPSGRGFPHLKWWQWALIAVGVLVLIGAISGALGGGRSDAGSSDDDPASIAGQQEEQPEAEPVMIVVPNVVGLDGVTARATLEALGFEVAYDGDDSMPVIAQDVVEGAEAEEGSTITLTLEEKPQLTLGQQNAIDSAQSYLDFSGFSRAGLYKQLTSEYGEGYEPADAEFALAYLEQNALVDWNAEAVESAESYLDFSSFSRQGLYEQLTSEYGEGFTPDQAEHALAAVGY
jgi:hypothetical protein